MIETVLNVPFFQEEVYDLFIIRLGKKVVSFQISKSLS